MVQKCSICFGIFLEFTLQLHYAQQGKYTHLNVFDHVRDRNISWSIASRNMMQTREVL